MDSISALWYCLPPAAILTQSYLIVSSVFICIQPKLNLYSLKFFQLPLFPIFHNYEVFHNLWGLDSCKFPISLIFYKTDLMRNSIRPGKFCEIENHKIYRNHKTYENCCIGKLKTFIKVSVECQKKDMFGMNSREKKQIKTYVGAHWCACLLSSAMTMSVRG